MVNDHLITEQEIVELLESYADPSGAIDFEEVAEAIVAWVEEELKFRSR